LGVVEKDAIEGSFLVEAGCVKDCFEFGAGLRIVMGERFIEYREARSTFCVTSIEDLGLFARSGGGERSTRMV
jgi:hypothetical protein